MHYVLAVRVHNHPGVLLRLVNLLYRRDVDLRSMTADLAPDSPTGHVSLGVDVEEAQAAQVCKYLERLEDVICVEALQQDKNLCRELAADMAQYEGYCICPACRAKIAAL